MSHDPWTKNVWTERQTAWFLAGLPEIDFEAEQVEGELDDAFPELGPHPEALEAYMATGNPADLARKWPMVVGPPAVTRPMTPEGKQAYEYLEKLRKAVRWRRIHPLNGEAIYWNGRMWAQTLIDEMPNDAEPIRFKITTDELARWMESERMPLDTALTCNYGSKLRAAETPSASQKTGNAPWWYVIPLCWGMTIGKLDATGEPRQVLREISKSMDRRGVHGGRPNQNSANQRAAVYAARENDEIELKGRVPSQSRAAAAGLFAYVAELAAVDAEDPAVLHRELLDAGVPTPGEDALATIGETLTL